MTKTAEQYLTEAQSKAVSNIAASILDYHSKHSIKELSDFALQEVNDYKERLKKDIEDARDSSIGDPAVTSTYDLCILLLKTA